MYDTSMPSFTNVLNVNFCKDMLNAFLEYSNRNGYSAQIL